MIMCRGNVQKGVDHGVWMGPCVDTVVDCQGTEVNTRIPPFSFLR